MYIFFVCVCKERHGRALLDKYIDKEMKTCVWKDRLTHGQWENNQKGGSKTSSKQCLNCQLTRTVCI